MPSRAELRTRVEQVLRGIAIAVLAVMLWRSLHERTDFRGRNVSARGVTHSTLADWTMSAEGPATVHVELDSIPSKIDRAWLSALASAGSRVTWSGDLAPVMIDAQPVASPSGGTSILVAAPTGSTVMMSDAVGPLDTLRAQNAGGMLLLNATSDRLEARVGGSLASTSPADSVILRRILVIGNAGWESKFAVAALEEEGWKVDGSIHVAPGVDVTQGSVGAIDTSRYSAVVALDGASLPYATRIRAFAEMGGGVVLAPQAASLDAMTSLRAGAVSSKPLTAPAVGPAGLANMSLSPIASLQNDAVVVERRPAGVALAARRIGAGRVLQSGYEDTWRLRTRGGESAVRDHRQLWSGLVRRVAYAPRVPGPLVSAGENQGPMIGLVADLGPKSVSPPTANLSGGPSGLMVLLFSLLALALFGEVALRRLRGAS